MTQPPEHDHATSPYPVGARQQSQPPQPPAPAKTNTMAIVGLICAFLAWPLGIVFSAIGLRQTRRRGEGGRGLALAGLIVSIVAGVISILVFVFVVMAGMQVAKEVEAEQAAAQELLDDTFGEDEATAAPELETDPVPSIDPAEATFSDPSCEALFGAGEGSVINLMAATAGITDPMEGLAHIDVIQTRLAEVRAAAPASMHADIDAMTSSVETSLNSPELAADAATQMEGAVMSLTEQCLAI